MQIKILTTLFEAPQSLISTSGSWAVGPGVSTVRSAINALTGTTGVRGTVGDEAVDSFTFEVFLSGVAPFALAGAAPVPFSVR